MVARSKNPPDSDPKGPGKHGGRRARAGRKPDRVIRAIAEVNDATLAGLAEAIPDLIANLKKLADGGYRRVTIKKEPDLLNGGFKVVERKIEWAEPDRRANEYLIDRVLGKPTARQELSGPDGEAIPVAFQDALAKVWGRGSDAG